MPYSITPCQTKGQSQNDLISRNSGKNPGQEHPTFCPHLSTEGQGKPSLPQRILETGELFSCLGKGLEQGTDGAHGQPQPYPYPPFTKGDIHTQLLLALFLLCKLR